MQNQVRFLYYRVLWTSFIVLISVTSFIYKPKYNKRSHNYSPHPYEFQLHSSEIGVNVIEQSPPQLSSSSSSTVQLKLLTFNILAPCYHKIIHNHTKTFESECKAAYIKRNTEICNLLLQADADIICIQEFWIENEILRKLYQTKLGAKYKMKELPRTSHWRDREDGLAMFLHRDRIILQDTKDIRFHDCGDRVAQLLLLAIKPKAYDSLITETSISTTTATPITSNTTTRSNNTDSSLSSAEILPKQQQQIDLPNQQFLCVNTHLLFPHNKGSTNIRVREMSKILDFVESYRQRELCESICGRSDVRIPVIVAGDFNGTPKGAVFGLMKSQNFRSAHEECWNYGHHHGASLVASSEIGGVSGDKDIMPVFTTTVSSGSRVSNTTTTTTTLSSPSASSVVSAISIPSSSSSSSSSVLFPIGDQTTSVNTNSNSNHSYNNSTATTTTNNPWKQWVSHKSHQNQIIAVDHVFYCNPSDQIEEKLPSLPNWTNLVFREVMQRVVDKLGTSNMSEIFAVFDGDNSGTITRQEFESALFNFGFRGDGTAALTPEEIAELIATADKNGDGNIDYIEFCDRFTTAFENIDDIIANSNNTSNVKVTVMTEGGNIKQMRNAFKRSKWMSKDFQSEKFIKNTITSAKPFHEYDDEDIHFNHDKEQIKDVERQKELQQQQLQQQQLNNNINSDGISVSSSSNNNINSLLSGRPMGDLSVSSVTLYPKELESGIWPSNFTLSDHGIVEVIFTAQVLTNEQ